MNCGKIDFLFYIYEMGSVETIRRIKSICDRAFNLIDYNGVDGIRWHCGMQNLIINHIVIDRIKLTIDGWRTIQGMEDALRHAEAVLDRLEK